jgi:hypothetical protein
MTEQDKDDFVKKMSLLPEYARLEQQKRQTLESLERVMTALQALDRRRPLKGADVATLCRHIGDARGLTKQSMGVVDAQLTFMDKRLEELAAAAGKSDVLNAVEQKIDPDIAEQREHYKRIESCSLREMFGMTPGTRVTRSRLSTTTGFRSGTYGFAFKPAGALPPYQEFRGYAVDTFDILQRVDGTLRAETVEKARGLFEDIKAGFGKTHQCRFEDFSFLPDNSTHFAQTKDFEMYVATGVYNNVAVWRDGTMVGASVEMRSDRLEEILRRGK